MEDQDFARLDEDNYAEGLNTFVIDIDLSSFLWIARTTIWRLERGAKAQALAQLEKNLEDDVAWYRVDFLVVASGLSYFYPTFSDASPKFFQATQISSTNPPASASKAAQAYALTGTLTAATTAPSSAQVNLGHGDVKFTAFHVGQGMCSMVIGSTHGVMFDAGAGKPVTRERYLAGLKRNDLQSSVASLASIPYFVLSHFDNDHWNVLAWDKSLRDKIHKILVPKVSKRSGRSVAFFDKEVIHKVEETAAYSISLGTPAFIEVRRSQPAASDSNGHALISVVAIGGRRALVPGDYVYARMKKDSESSIKHWAVGPYAAVVVPHHGDEESAEDVPPCMDGGKAFFSAGTHDTWDHPKQVSIDKHELAKYQVIHKKTEPDIISRTLI
ncbi:MAG: hypothetical protein H6716_27855 [Polyangiaceae bacterium]|nr:hypothetical protein [Polyangiaceae bacterium]